MNALLSRILDAHGGEDLWRSYECVDADILTSGGFFALKGMTADAATRRATVWMHEGRSSLTLYGAADQCTLCASDRVAIEKLDGTVVSERRAPRDSFAGHQMQTPWDLLHRAYFDGAAFWTYFSTPFLLALKGVHVEERAPWQEGDETWRVLQAYFPGSIETHSLTQEFFFGEDLLLRQHDYRVNLAGGFAVSQLVGHYIEAGGSRLPTRRRAYLCGPDRRPVRDVLLQAVDISVVEFR
jgi:hypothetical protein